MPAPAPSSPLIVRLRNWVGDVSLSVPTLQRLADAGHALHLVGKGWAADLLAGHGWPVTVLPARTRDRVRLLRDMRRTLHVGGAAGGKRPLNAVCFPYSFSSALEFRLAGLRAIGHAREGRGLLLGKSVPRPAGVHELQAYWQLGSALLGGEPVAPPGRIGLRLAPQHTAQAQALRRRFGLQPGYVVICPFSGGTYEGQDKAWPGFPDFAAAVLPRFGRQLVVCPGPGEEGEARGRFAAATVLPDVGLGAYAALLQDAALMVSNDTGPGHIAAAVGAPLLSVLGPTDPALWGAWGPTVSHVGGCGRWPSTAQVEQAVAGRLGAA